MTAVHPALAAELAHLDLQVTPQNVLQVAGALRAEADHLRGELRIALQDSEVGKPGEDPVSGPAATAFNAKIKAMYGHVQEYIETLHSFADRLTVTARDFGHTEEAIKRNFDTARARHAAIVARGR